MHKWFKKAEFEINRGQIGAFIAATSFIYVVFAIATLLGYEVISGTGTGYVKEVAEVFKPVLVIGSYYILARKVRREEAASFAVIHSTALFTLTAISSPIATQDVIITTALLSRALVHYLNNLVFFFVVYLGLILSFDSKLRGKAFIGLVSLPILSVGISWISSPTYVALLRGTLPTFQGTAWLFENFHFIAINALFGFSVASALPFACDLFKVKIQYGFVFVSCLLGALIFAINTVVFCVEGLPLDLMSALHMLLNNLLSYGLFGLVVMLSHKI
ncbi:MAG: hypothetical protein QXP42_01085 [Candidatus Micrarchaeia archaeon]